MAFPAVSLSDIAARIDQVVRTHWDSTTKAAASLALPRASLGRYQSGATEPGVTFIGEFSLATGVSTDWLILGKDRPEPAGDGTAGPPIELVLRIMDAIQQEFRAIGRVEPIASDLYAAAYRQAALILRADPRDRAAMVQLVAMQAIQAAAPHRS